MMKIYNTLSRSKQEFIPIESGKVKMYVCGPTVYNYFHIGNAKTFLFFDVVRRYLEYCGNEVIYVQNLTDIDDKLIDQSLREKRPVAEIAEKYIKAFLEDIEKLGLKRPSHLPRATEYIEEMIELIKDLEKKGIAYEINGDVYFSVTTFEEYGKLSGKKLSELKAGARVEENIQKEHPADFTLWKKAKPGEPQWNSPWGKGRPGWHTECVVMSRKLLGDTFDIHGGAIDLIFPHHENEIAQAESTSKLPLANYWMHGGFLNIEGEKMSKSLKNFSLTRDVLKHYDPEAIRFFFLSKHYRSNIDYSPEILMESTQAVKNLYSTLQGIDYLSFHNDFLPDQENKKDKIRAEFKKIMDDDFNTAKAIAYLFDLGKVIKNPDEVESTRKLSAQLLVEIGQVLGFFNNIEQKLTSRFDNISIDLIELLISYRKKFKDKKNWEMADLIRNDLKELGIELQDTSKGTKWIFSE